MALPPVPEVPPCPAALPPVPEPAEPEVEPPVAVLPAVEPAATELAPALPPIPALPPVLALSSPPQPRNDAKQATTKKEALCIKHLSKENITRSSIFQGGFAQPPPGRRWFFPNADGTNGPQHSFTRWCSDF